MLQSLMKCLIAVDISVRGLFMVQSTRKSSLDFLSRWTCISASKLCAGLPSHPFPMSREARGRPVVLDNHFRADALLCDLVVEPHRSSGGECLVVVEAGRHVQLAGKLKRLFAPCLSLRLQDVVVGLHALGRVGYTPEFIRCFLD